MFTGISMNNITKTESIDLTATVKSSKEQTVDTTEKQPSYDTFEKSHEYDVAQVNSLKDKLNAQQTILKERLMSMIADQTGIYNLSINNTKFQLTDEEIEWAKQAISEGGEYSVDAVATNIMDMAKALAGETGEYISMLKEAVDMGFEQATSIFGGNMPDITGETYNEIMKRFDEWQQEFEEKAEEIKDLTE